MQIPYLVAMDLKTEREAFSIGCHNWQHPYMNPENSSGAEGGVNFLDVQICLENQKKTYCLGLA